MKGKYGEKTQVSVGYTKPEEFHKEGEIWEINNGNKEHGVVNNSDVDRIHMIVDYKKDIVDKLI